MDRPSKKPDIKQLGAIRRQSVSVSQDQVVKMEPLRADGALPLLIRPAVDGVGLIDWVAGQREWLDAQLGRCGGILFRGFDMRSEGAFERLIRAVSPDVLGYNDRATPRSQVSDIIFTSTDYPADQHIELHNESSYARTWPLRILFFCAVAARQGGETPIADSRNVFRRIDPAIRERFVEKGVMYVRNFGEGLGMPWQTVFNTADRGVMEDYCRAQGIKVEWKDENRLRTRQVRPAVARHPHTGDLVWFNQATAFHVSTLAPAVREALLADFAPEDLPKNCFYGDGSPIEDEVLDHIREAYRQETVAFPWQEGDVLLLDNMLVAHGRAPFAGPRKVLVGMAQAWSWETLA